MEGPEVFTISFVFPNGDKYDGECTRTPSGTLERNGTGIHITPNGIIYEGNWRDDRMSQKRKKQWDYLYHRMESRGYILTRIFPEGGQTWAIYKRIHILHCQHPALSALSFCLRYQLGQF
ncbi:MORN repeat-containing protein 2 isoform X2 [Pleurodeles waltl]|uniref:MORN repeat-containing protein 2 isoform X2 n=1 Tax=Pleurodeles waltl TaxID=8319 RepID=UPI003709B711